LVGVLTVRRRLSQGVRRSAGAPARGGADEGVRVAGLGWGAFLALFVIALFGLLQNAGDVAGLLAVIVLLLTILAAAFGSTCVCEWLGGRLYELMPHREPSRCGRLVLGSIVLPLMMITPPGWVALLFVIALSLGTCRLAIGGSR